MCGSIPAAIAFSEYALVWIAGALPRGVEEVAAQRVLRRERDRVQETVQPPPPRPDLVRNPFDVLRVVRVHLEDVHRLRQAPSGLLGETHRAAERRQHDLRALLLKRARRRVGDRLPRQHAGDEQLLALEQHRDPLREKPC
jgi:hypothetical protein